MRRSFGVGGLADLDATVAGVLDTGTRCGLQVGDAADADTAIAGDASKPTFEASATGEPYRRADKYD